VRELDHLLAEEEVLGHDFVYGELSLRDRGGRAKLLEAYAQMIRAPLVSHDEVVDLVRSRKLGGRGIGWIDAHLLASALVARAALWTADALLAGAAQELGASLWSASHQT
jgi:hypothetical protein